MDMEKPLVSIFTITYNHINFIDEFFESLISQTYTNWEVVIGDDCSQDGTQERLKEYAQKYPNQVKLILNEKNLGITKNSQNVLKACKGKYICPIAGDDLLLPTKLEKQVSIMESNSDINMCYHNLEVFYEDGSESINFSSINSYTPSSGTIKEMIENGSFAGACSLMLRGSAIPDGGLDSRISVASDWLLFVESVGSGEFVYIDEVLGKYRRHSANVTSSMNEKAIDDHILSCGVLMIKYPKYIKSIKKRLATVFFEKAVMNMKNSEFDKFRDNIKSSVSMSINKKNIILFLLDKIGLADYNKLYKIKNKFKKSM
jgi:glycosyltransferase involved in cell wall biosynthesis